MTNDEVDRYLAEKLMGWVLDPATQLYCDGLKAVIAKQIWQPTRRISQALGDGGEGTVVGAMKKLGFVSYLTNDTRKQMWQADILFEKTATLFTKSNDHPAEAISRAAVAALEGT